MVHLNCCCVFPVADPAEQRHMYLHLVSETLSLYRHKCLFERLKHFNFTIPNIFLGRDVYFGIAATSSIDTNNCVGNLHSPPDASYLPATDAAPGQICRHRATSTMHPPTPVAALPPPSPIPSPSSNPAPYRHPQSRHRRSNHLLELVVLGTQKKYVFVMYILHQAIFRVLFCITYWRCSKGLEVQSG